MRCPVCDSPMELVTVVRKAKGSAQAIKCPTCRTSTFLTKEAASRLQVATRAALISPPSEPSSHGAQWDYPVDVAPAERDRAPTSLFEDFVAWLNS